MSRKDFNVIGLCINASSDLPTFLVTKPYKIIRFNGNIMHGEIPFVKYLKGYFQGIFKNGFVTQLSFSFQAQLNYKIENDVVMII